MIIENDNQHQTAKAQAEKFNQALNNVEHRQRLLVVERDELWNQWHGLKEQIQAYERSEQQALRDLQLRELLAQLHERCLRGHGVYKHSCDGSLFLSRRAVDIVNDILNLIAKEWEIAVPWPMALLSPHLRSLIEEALLRSLPKDNEDLMEFIESRRVLQ